MARESENRTNVENLRLSVTEFYETLLENSFNVTWMFLNLWNFRELDSVDGNSTWYGIETVVEICAPQVWNLVLGQIKQSSKLNELRNK